MVNAITVSPSDAPALRERVKALPDGAEVRFEPGVYRGGLWIERSITLRAAGGPVVLERDNGPIVEVANSADAEVAIEGMTFRGGRGRIGGVAVHLARKVRVADCRFEGGDAEIAGVLVRAAEAELTTCQFVGNAAQFAHAVLAYNGGRVRLTDCVVADNAGAGAGVMCQGAALVVLDHCTVMTRGQPAVRVIGGGVDAPIFQALASILGDPPLEVVRGGTPVPNATLHGCALSRPLPPGADDLGSNAIGDLALTPQFGGVAGAVTEGRGVRRSSSL